MTEFTVEAKAERLEEVLAFINRQIEGVMKASLVTQIDIAVEEIFVNIASYAYHPEIGAATIQCQVDADPVGVTIIFIDAGKPYNPLSREDPDITLGAEERQVGGLGIFMVKNMMDEVTYQYQSGKNILTIKKKNEP